MSQYIGKTISLISNKGIRYVGILDNIDADNGTVSLNQVKSFGTEGRVTDVAKMVPPKSDVFGHVMFKGSDVQDLNILDCDISQVYPEPIPHTPVQTPSPVTQSAPSAQAAPKAEVVKEAQPASAPAQPQSQPQQQAPESRSREPSNNQGESDGRRQNQNTVYQANQKQSRPQGRPQQAQNNSNTNKVEIPKDDFDFESSNAKFTKEEDAEKEAANVDDSSETYNKKSSFFDSLSSSTEQNDRLRWSEEKNLNYDTFGQTSLHRGRGRGQRGGYRGQRGGRGFYRGGRGNFRGGYNNNGYNNANSNNGSKPEWA